MAQHEIHARITGPVVMIGFGSIGRGTLPLIQRHKVTTTAGRSRASAPPGLAGPAAWPMARMIATQRNLLLLRMRCHPTAPA